MVKLKRLKADSRERREWIEPTPKEKAESLARRQKRCPFDLTKLADWPPDAFLEWGRWAIEHDVLVDMDGDVDHLLYHARRTAERHDGLLSQAFDDFIAHFDFFLEGLKT